MKNTRSIIIQTAFEAIHKNGFHQLRIDKEIAKLGITKGAFYHYFNNKGELLKAVISEILGPGFVKPWKSLAHSEEHIIDSIQHLLQNHIDQSSLAEIKYGCIYNNLVHEVSVELPEVREVLLQYFEEILAYLEQAIERGIEKKQIKPTLKSNDLSLLIMSVYNGSNSMNKLYQKSFPYKKSIKAIILLLESIRNE